MRKSIITAILLLISLQGFAQDKVYKASFFGIRSNGITDNTTSIQNAIDFIASKGGGTLEFSVGRYITGAIELKSGVDIMLREGAVIVGSDNIYAYRGHKGIFWGEGVKDVTIYGKGVIDGRGPALLFFTREQIKMRHNVSLKDFIMRYPATRNDLYIVEGGDVKVEGCYTDIRQ